MRRSIAALRGDRGHHHPRDSRPNPTTLADLDRASTDAPSVDESVDAEPQTTPEPLVFRL
ncbi:MAG TPA: hypothetical protein VGJ86_03370 [Acidimicrobiales bacterium]